MREVYPVLSDGDRLRTERLTLRHWLPGDYRPFAEMNADPEVMKFFPRPLTAVESDALADTIASLMITRGWGLWAVEHKHSKCFIGFVGLHEPEIELPFNPCVEIGWRLSRQYWRQGYATEAARAALKYAFEVLCLNEVVSFTSVPNKPSQAVMRRLNMRDSGENFAHPKVPPDNPLCEHVLYKISRERWKCYDVSPRRAQRLL